MGYAALAIVPDLDLCACSGAFLTMVGGVVPAGAICIHVAGGGDDGVEGKPKGEGGG